MTHDLVIANGTVVDGTGAPARRADVAIDGDTITAVAPPGQVERRGSQRVLDATDCIVTPGFVDAHTHLDAQLHWDPLGTSSCWHGVTSVVLGNCGVTFAPVRPGDREFLARMMESVEAIPAASILDGMSWDWESYGGFLDALERRPAAVNVGGLVGHCAVRAYAMGPRSIAEDAVPSPFEMDTMVRLVDEAMRAGALGFSTSRTLRHTVPDGRCVPGTWAGTEELLALAGVLGRHGRGLIECAPRFDGEGPSEPRVESELAWMEAVSRHSKRPVTFNLTQTREQGAHYRVALRLAAEANARGAQIRPQTTPRGVGVLFHVETMTPFDGLPGWQELKALPLGRKLAAFRERRAELDAEFRASLVAATDNFERYFVMLPETGARYDCDPDDSLAAHARRRECSVAQAYLDLVAETGGAVVVSWPILNQDLERVYEMLRDPNILMGLADSGAHVTQILDASQPTSFLLYWVRERGAFELEEAIRRLSADTAAFVGLDDRGVLAPGRRADCNVVDFDNLFLEVPRVVRDFPHGAARFVQRARGYRATVVNGDVTFIEGEHTGALPGRVLRGS